MICPYCKKEIEPIEDAISTINIVKDKDGRRQTWTEETRDLDGILLSKRVDEYSYFDKTGDVDTIILKTYDGDNLLLSEKEVKHYNNSTLEG